MKAETLTVIVCMMIYLELPPSTWSRAFARMCGLITMILLTNYYSHGS